MTNPLPSKVQPLIADSEPIPGPALERRLERLGLADNRDQWTERYLLCEQLVDTMDATARQKFESTSCSHSR